MSLNKTPQGERTHIGIFGRTNVGKSSLINALTNQDTAIVSDVRGTTTDPVHKAMELLPLGPVVIIDTPGLDDDTQLGQERVKSTRKVLRKTDIVMLVADASTLPEKHETELLKLVKEMKLPIIIVFNKVDQDILQFEEWELVADEYEASLISVSAVKQTGIEDLKEQLGKLNPNKTSKILVKDLVKENETCLLVIPIDSAAPKGRLILPQQQVIRDLLDGGVNIMVTRDTEYENALGSLKEKPALVITDSQAFAYVSERTPDDVKLTSFSILFARYKGDLKTLVDGANEVEKLKDGYQILVCEGCTHHRQCDDIGTVKIPGWLQNYTKKEFHFTFVNGTGFPEDLSAYKLIVHCGACMLNEREMTARIRIAKQAGKSIVNYGILIAYLNGILERCIAPLNIRD